MTQIRAYQPNHLLVIYVPREGQYPMNAQKMPLAPPLCVRPGRKAASKILIAAKAQRGEDAYVWVNNVKMSRAI